MPIPTLRLAVLALICTLGSLSADDSAGPRLLPDARITEFALPGFNPAGFRLWQLVGQEGLFLEDEVVQVNQLEMRLFSGDSRGLLQSTIKSPSALLQARHNRATGDGPITVTGSGFTIEGEGWVWTGDNHTILIRRDVSVTFAQSLRYIIE
jgi:hypothetical protein